jgi:hypothetical protein
VRREGAEVTVTRKRRSGKDRRQASKAGEVDSDMWALLCHICENHPRYRTVFIVRGCWFCRWG